MLLSPEERNKRCQDILSKININQICELKAISRPPELMNKLGQLLVMIINPSSGSKNYQWIDFLKLSSAEPHKFLPRLRQFSLDNLNEVQINNAMKFISQNQFESEKIREKMKNVSVLFAHLLEWLLLAFADAKK